MIWTEQQIEQLTTLFESGLSHSRIAAEMGTTRNTVCGKTARLGLTRAQAHHGNRSATHVHKKRVYKPRTVYKKRAAEVEPLHIDLMQLTATTCRFPYGEGPFTFCGCPVQAEKPYCPAHVTLCMTPAKNVLRLGKTLPRSFAGGGTGGPRMFA